MKKLILTLLFVGVVGQTHAGFRDSITNAANAAWNKTKEAAVAIYHAVAGAGKRVSQKVLDEAEKEAQRVFEEKLREAEQAATNAAEEYILRRAVGLDASSGK